ncbi:spore coat polysaccharide biosynthesis protein SpsF [Halobacillus dabanensis]|uniref:Spore coat polysaccharide biosynthesis protein SpsF n=1 Tax=Halobacillus dabanensis TaxID=240302 RepID=A0A1I3U4V2_HALDA|nr:glycosyltransferase family protein [Halobacillus dabanensis]SFJ77579.1 spore coat polysaccharide biosynthesis protein SpsF [Halobacillus dabanensis]
MKVTAVVQARMGSTRLPGKVLRQVNGKPLLEYQIERMKRSERIDQLVVSTSRRSLDDPIIELCQRLKVDTFRGSEKDVLGRFYETCAYYKADAVVRLTADCPLIDPAVIDKIIHYFLKKYPRYMYVSNTRKRSYPRGLDTEVFTYEALKDAYMNANSPHDLEHVTPFIMKRIGDASIAQVLHDSDESHHRWTVDTPEDFQFVSKVLERLYPTNPTFTFQDILEVLRKNPDWQEINRQVKQKGDP